MDELGRYLRSLRGDKSLREVQKHTGISHTYLSTLERGYDPRTKKPRKPSPDVLRKLADFYKVDYFGLLFKAGYIDDQQLWSYLNKCRTGEVEFMEIQAEEGRGNGLSGLRGNRNIPGLYG